MLLHLDPLRGPLCLLAELDFDKWIITLVFDPTILLFEEYT